MAGHVGCEVGRERVEHVEVEAGDEGVVFAYGGLGGDEHAVALRRGHVDAMHSSWLSVDAIDLYDCHFVLVKVEVGGGEGGHADDADEICFARINGEVDVLRVVEEIGVGNGLVAGGVRGGREIGADEGGKWVVVPV